MTSLNLAAEAGASPNPVDLVEELASANDWSYERTELDEVTLFIEGSYTDFQFRVFWREAYKTLQYACLFDMRIPTNREKEIYRLLGLINERLWLGHFELWAEENVLLFRYGSLAADPMIGQISEEHIALVIETALQECDRFYPVFQFVIWGGQSAEQAIESAMLECEGNA